LKTDTTPLFHISRNFVEFGAFTALEIVNFRQRGILRDHDYIRSTESQDWLPLAQWLSKVASGLAEPRTTAKATPRKRSAPTTKASKKAA
jgi:hypothetical protein